MFLKRNYIAGDTDPIAENARIRCDVALVPVGGGYTMGKKHAAEFIADMNPKAAAPRRVIIIYKPDKSNIVHIFYAIGIL